MVWRKLSLDRYSL